MKIMPAIVLLGQCLISTSVFAQAECRDALVISTYNSNANSRIDYRLAEYVSEEAFRKINSSQNAGVKVPIYGVPVEGSWSQYRNTATSMAKSRGINTRLSQSQAENVMWTGLDPNAVSAYRECLSTRMHAQIGRPHIGVRTATDTDVSVYLSYLAAPGQKNTYPLTWTSNIRTIDGQPLPDRIRSGAEITVVLARPAKQQQVAINSFIGGASLVIEPLPPPIRAIPCSTGLGRYKFDMSGCGGSFSLNGNRLEVSFGHGRSSTIPRGIPDYDARLGRWLAGDFNGDGRDDLAHLVTHVPGLDARVHVFFSSTAENSGFRAPTTFVFRDHANPQRDYSAELGSWDIEVDRDTKMAMLVHNPRLPDGRIHEWVSSGNGAFAIRNR